ncbi:MAG TPA: hypothetical protein PK585_03965 [Amphiplicatus sp.]|nr:hypothetical protein [Amphiplicatus sp.]MCB9956021.1 hypothetical protein [Caulobacterales bacterium]HOP19215.1 hypothetical protein [Amphiplicatus sp.]
MTRKLLLAAALGAPLLLAGASLAADLRPDQKAAVEKLLADIDPATRDYLRPQMEESVAMLNEAQIADLVAGMDDSGSGDTVDEEEAYEEEPTATPEDLAYNRAQFEPVYRKHWQAQKDFDAFADATLAAKCADREKYAVFGSAYRYELPTLAPNWPRAADNVDAAVAIFTDAYAPKDGRYKFDFSNVRMSFDKPAVEAAISKACAAWNTEAAAFYKKARPLADANDFAGAQAAANAGAAKMAPIAQALETALNEQAPAADYSFFMAMQSGERLN